MPGWQRKRDFTSVQIDLYYLQKLNFQDYYSRAVDNPKSSAGHRSLNIPSRGLRLYLHGLHSILSFPLESGIQVHPSKSR